MLQHTGTPPLFPLPPPVALNNQTGNVVVNPHGRTRLVLEPDVRPLGTLWHIRIVTNDETRYTVEYYGSLPIAFFTAIGMAAAVGALHTPRHERRRSAGRTWVSDNAATGCYCMRIACRCASRCRRHRPLVVAYMHQDGRCSVMCAGESITANGTTTLLTFTADRLIAHGILR